GRTAGGGSRARARSGCARSRECPGRARAGTVAGRRNRTPARRPPRGSPQSASSGGAAAPSASRRVPAGTRARAGPRRRCRWWCARSAARLAAGPGDEVHETDRIQPLERDPLDVVRGVLQLVPEVAVDDLGAIDDLDAVEVVAARRELGAQELGADPEQ